MSDETTNPSPARGRDQTFKVGMFVIVAITITLTLLYTMTDAAFFRGRYVVTTIVPDAGGIRRGDPVQMRGVNIGRILGFSIGPTGVTIRLEIEGEFKIPKDSKVELKSAGLLGGMVADVLPGSGTEFLKYGDTVAGAAEESTSSATNRIFTSADAAIGRVQALLSDAMIKNVHDSTAETRALLQQMSTTIKDQREDLKVLTASLRKNSENMEKVTSAPELDRSLKRVDEVTARAERIAASLEASAKSMQALSAKIERGEGSLGLAIKDDALYNELTKSTTGLQKAGTEISQLVADIRKNPKKYLKFSIF